jgi:hypothetical protein
MAIEETKGIIKLSSSIWRGCEHCHERMGDSIEDQIAHYVQAHGYRLLHVGQESTHHPDGRDLWHSTVAILGHDDPPAKAPPAAVVIGMPPDPVEGQG